jgi:hypothetical protein
VLGAGLGLSAGGFTRLVAWVASALRSPEAVSETPRPAHLQARPAQLTKAPRATVSHRCAVSGAEPVGRGLAHSPCTQLADLTGDCEAFLCDACSCRAIEWGATGGGQGGRGSAAARSRAVVRGSGVRWRRFHAADHDRSMNLTIYSNSFREIV